MSALIILYILEKEMIEIKDRGDTPHTHDEENRNKEDPCDDLSHQSRKSD